MAPDGKLLGHSHQPYQSMQQFNMIGLLILHGFQRCNLESVQSIVYALSLSNISFSPETFVEIAAALPLVCVCFFCSFVFVAVSFCVSFVDDLTTESFVAAPAALDWVLVFFIGSELWELCTWCFLINASLLAMLDTTSLVDCKDNVFDSSEQWNFDITSGGEHVTMPTPMGKTFNLFPQGVFISYLPFFPWQTNHRPLCRLWFWVCISHDKVDYEDDMHRV